MRPSDWEIIFDEGAAHCAKAANETWDDEDREAYLHARAVLAGLQMGMHRFRELQKRGHCKCDMPIVDRQDKCSICGLRPVSASPRGGIRMSEGIRP